MVMIIKPTFALVPANDSLSKAKRSNTEEPVGFLSTGKLFPIHTAMHSMSNPAISNTACGWYFLSNSLPTITINTNDMMRPR
jgi:hypothetical protein